MAPFGDAIAAAMRKVNQYYVKTAESDAHIMAMREFTNYIFFINMFNDRL
jgi:hypothetical protein